MFRKKNKKLRNCLNLFFKEFKVLKVFKVIIAFLLRINKNYNLKYY